MCDDVSASDLFPVTTPELLTMLRKSRERRARRLGKGTRDIMQNVVMRVEDNKLLIEVDLTTSFGPTESGKSILIGSTRGTVSVPGHEEIKVGVNVFRPK